MLEALGKSEWGSISYLIEPRFYAVQSICLVAFAHSVLNCVLIKVIDHDIGSFI